MHVHRCHICTQMYEGHDEGPTLGRAPQLLNADQVPPTRLLGLVIPSPNAFQKAQGELGVANGLEVRCNDQEEH